MKIFSERRTFTDGRRRTEFEMISDQEPSSLEVAESQSRCGYSPEGYSGPWGRKTIKNDEGNFVTTWGCAGSCD